MTSSKGKIYVLLGHRTAEPKRVGSGKSSGSYMIGLGAWPSPRESGFTNH
jgi:hypothetical protein